MTIEEFISARLDEDERIASAANGGGPWHAIDMAEEGIAILAGEDDGDPEAGYSYSPPRTGETRHITRHDPARVLRQVVAVRDILGLAQSAMGAHQADYEPGGTGDEAMYGYRMGAAFAYFPVLKAFAAIWADHSDYQEVWKP